MTGYIRLHRKIIRWSWYKDANTSRLFLHLLLKANWEDGRFQGVEVPRGSFVSSYQELAQEIGLSVKNIRTALEHLKKTGEVAVSRHSKFSVFTVKNYSVYQASSSQVAENRQAEGKQPATIKESKNKKIKEIYTHAYAREDRNAAKKERVPSSGTGFSNFQQREYDFDQLEQLILQSQEASQKV